MRKLSEFKAKGTPSPANPHTHSECAIFHTFATSLICWVVCLRGSTRTVPELYPHKTTVRR
jgi:hypothetical protein